MIPFVTQLSAGCIKTKHGSSQMQINTYTQSEHDLALSILIWIIAKQSFPHVRDLLGVFGQLWPLLTHVILCYALHSARLTDLLIALNTCQMYGS